MNQYMPDKWQVIEVTINGETFRKILASWYGGFAGADSWRISSVIEDVKDDGEFYVMQTASGSEYKCNKGWEGTSMLAYSKYEEFKALVEARGGVLSMVDM